MRLPTTAASMPAVVGPLDGLDQAEIRLARGAHDEAERGVADPAAQLGAEVDGDEVAVAQAVAARDAVHDRVVDGDAEDGREGGRCEGRAVPQEG
jgi:hypothetical protein